jgi:hypothetical protein
MNEILSKIQKELQCPKSQYNQFGKYHYRSCEDIFEAVKAILPENTYLTVSDEIVHIEGRWYVKATAKLSNKETHIENTAYAREPAMKKGMDEAQITGATSSYARKYALNGLFLIDDVKDPDSTNKHEKNGKDKGVQKEVPKEPLKKPEAPNIKSITAKQKEHLNDLMKEKGLMAKEKKALYDFVLSGSENGESSEWASDFIKDFNNYFDLFVQSEVYQRDEK